MTHSSQLLLFTDLDGSLLDHRTYAWEQARPALDALSQRRIPLVIVTSKTRAEVARLREELGHHDPYIVENGAVTCIPRGYFADNGDSGAVDDICLGTGPIRSALGDAVESTRQQGAYRFRSFAELGPEGIARCTGLSLEDAAAANDRVASEPLLWEDTEQQLQAFSRQMSARGLRCVRGGRFVHLMGQFDKADAAAGLMPRFRLKFGDMPLTSVAIGDGPNDLAMLEWADIAVVIAGAHGHPMPLPPSQRVIRTKLPAPAGWRDAVLALLEEFCPGT